MSQTKRSSADRALDDRGAYRTSRRAMLRTAGMGALAVAGSATLPGTANTALAQEATPVASPAAGAPGGIHVFPRHDTRTASPETEISFRGVTEVELGTVTVVGSVSGGHSGLLISHSDRNGVSYVPDSRFEPGEQVTVQTEAELGPTGDGSLMFTVVRPSVLPSSPTSRVTDDPEVPPHAFRSRPDLRPPVMEITVPADGVAEGHITLSTRVEDGQAGATILDNSGEFIWFNPPANDLDEHHDVRVQEYQGEPVITYVEGNGPRGYRLGHFVMLDNSYQPVKTFQIGNGLTGGDLHEFLLTQEGTALVGCYHPVRWDLSSVGGPQNGTVLDAVVQEMDLETGRVLFEWHSLDDIAVDESYTDAPEEADAAYDYIHYNSAGITPDGDVIVSGRHTHAIYTIDRDTGDLVWRLNGKQSDFEMGEGSPFSYQHDARVLPGGEVTLFDNAANGPNADVQSRGLVLELDMDAMTATLAREYVHPEGIVSGSQANLQTLPNGNAFVGWGSAPDFSEFTEDGELVFNGRFPEGGTSYRAYRFPWSGQPVDPPDLAAEISAEGEATVYVSWNGATEVETWQILAGPDAQQLQPVGSVSRTGFETAIVVETTEPYVAAQALDGDNNALGTSEAVQVAG